MKEHDNQNDETKIKLFVKTTKIIFVLVPG